MVGDNLAMDSISALLLWAPLGTPEHRPEKHICSQGGSSLCLQDWMAKPTLAFQLRSSNERGHSECQKGQVCGLAGLAPDCYKYLITARYKHVPFQALHPESCYIQ